MHQHVTYTTEVGRKFHADGAPRLFPGNTIICFVDRLSAAFQHACQMQEQLRQQPFGAKFAILPADSLHMTVMELLCDQVRVPEKWSRRLELQAPLENTDRFFLDAVPRALAPTNVRIVYESIYHQPNIMLLVQPADAATEAAVRAYRDVIAQITGVRFPDHEAYRFHISLAYRLVELDDREEEALTHMCRQWDADLRANFGVLDAGQPRLTFFDDMFRFVPAEERLTLRSRGRLG